MATFLCDKFASLSIEDDCSYHNTGRRNIEAVTDGTEECIVENDLSIDCLRNELILLGFQPGPIIETTKRVYLKKLRELKKQKLLATSASTFQPSKKVFSPELENALNCSTWSQISSCHRFLEEKLVAEFQNPHPLQKWREGTNKTSFNYLLLDPRILNNLPRRAEHLPSNQVWETFLSAIFYVGKGKRNRPYDHLYEAVSLWNQAKLKTENKKLQHILDIWREDRGVVCLHIFQNIIPAEAYTREAAIISALRLENIANAKQGDFYGILAAWTQNEKNMLGVYLLYKAMGIFLHEGERQLRPSDIN